MSRMIRRCARGRARRRAAAAGLVGVLSLLGVLPSTATADPSPSTTELHSRASNLALGDDDVPAEAANQGPDDECGYPLPGLEERCEKWTISSWPPGVTRVSPASDRLFKARVGFVDGTSGLLIEARDASSGEKLWEVFHDAPQLVRLVDLVVSNDGRRLYAVGDDKATGAVNTDIALTAHDAATGDQLWRVVLGLPGIDESDRIESVEKAGAIAVSPDGRRVYLTGTTVLYDRLEGRRVTHEDVIVAAYDALTGSKRWVTTWGARFDFERGEFLAVSPDSRKVYVGGGAPCPVGQDHGEACPGDFLAIGLQGVDPADPGREGRVLWVSRYDGFGPDVLSSMDLAPDGSQLYLTGISGGSGGFTLKTDYATVAFRTANGQQAWVSRYDGADPSVADGHHRAYSVAASPSGDKVFVTGATTTSAPLAATAQGSGVLSDMHVGTIAYDASTGQEVWVAIFGLPTRIAALGGDPDGGTSIAVSPDGKRVYVGGKSGEVTVEFTISGSRTTTLAYDAATGNQHWVARAPSSNSPSVTAGRDGSLVYTSTSNRDGRVWAYDASP